MTIAPLRVRPLAALTLALGLLAAAASPTRGDMVITEYMYQGNGGEFIEFTNVGATAIDLAGWSYDDDSRTPGVTDLSAFGTVQAGESVILSEAAAAAFRATWSLPASVDVIGGYTNNLGRADEINLFDASGGLVDRLTYGDNAFPGTIRTQTVSGIPSSFAVLGANSASGWILSRIGDIDGAYASNLGDIGSPGAFRAVPEPGAAALVLLGLPLVAAAIRRRRSR